MFERSEETGVTDLIPPLFQIMEKLVRELLEEAIASKYPKYYLLHRPPLDKGVSLDEAPALELIEHLGPGAGNAESTAEPAGSAALDSAKPNLPDLPPTSAYSCRRCRAPLFGPDQVRPHGAGLNSFSRHQTGGTCSNVYLHEPAEWMDLSGGNADRVCCPKCGSKLGSYSWSGSQCPCGTWVVPSFGVHGSRVDPPAASNVGWGATTVGVTAPEND